MRTAPIRRVEPRALLPPSQHSADQPDDPLDQAAPLAAITAFIEQAAIRPSGLVIHGEVGAGKSTLWQAGVALARRRGTRVLVCRPSESEASLAFASLGDLLDGALDGEIGLPPPQLRALRVAILLDDPDDAPPDQRAVAVATLTLLRSLAARSPVMIAIDDAHCLDPATGRSLAFAVRRLASEPVGVLIAQRHAPGEISGLGSVEIDGRAPGMLTPEPLGMESLDVLLRRHVGSAFPWPVLRQIAAASGGNPLFALEIARAIDRGEIEPGSAERLAVPRTLHQLVADRLIGLPDAQRELLFVVAALSNPSVELLTRFDATRDVIDLLQQAESAGVISIRGRRIRFAHPLFGSTVYHSVPADRRRELHRRLASFVSGQERAHQLSLGAEGPDSGVAETLAGEAIAAAARGAPDAAASLAEHAVRLTPVDQGDTILQRRVLASRFHFAAGDSARARRGLESVVKSAKPGPERAAVLRRLAEVRYRTDSVSRAADLLTRALEESGEDRSLRSCVERDLAWAVTLCGDVAEAERHAESAMGLVDPTPDTETLAELLAAQAMARFLRGHGFDVATMERAIALERSSSDVPIEWRPRMILGMMQKWSGDLAVAAGSFSTLHRETLDAGDEASLPFLLAQMSETETLAGDAERALEHAVQANTLAKQTGQEPIRAFALHARALAEAYLGRCDEARLSALEGLTVAESAGSVVAMMLNQGVLGFVELSCDEPAAAEARLGPLVAWLEVVGIREPGVVRAVPDAVEALIALGELDRADALLQTFADDASRLGRDWALLAAARLRGSARCARGETDGAIRDLQAAIDEYGPRVAPFELGRAMLVLGAAQRRTRRRKVALSSLGEAVRLFDSAGAAAWAAKGRRLMGGRTGRGGPGTSGDAVGLTAAEQRVVELVIAGLTNREAAARLFVSVRGVEVHLTNSYRKLGVRSRTELAAKLSPRRAPADNPTDVAAV